MNHRHALLESISYLLKTIPEKSFVKNLVEILEITFIVMNDLPDVIVVSTQDICNKICSRILKKMKKYLTSIDDYNFRRVIQIFANNLLVYKEQTHELAKEGLRGLAHVKKTNLVSLLYMSRNKENEDIVFSPLFV